MNSIIHENINSQGKKHWSPVIFFVFIVNGIILGSVCYFGLEYQVTGIIISLLFIPLAHKIAKVEFSIN
jgi:hypothetical protein